MTTTTNSRKNTTTSTNTTTFASTTTTTTERLSKALTESQVGTFENMVLLAARGIHDSYEWLSWAIHEIIPDLFTMMAVDWAAKSAHDRFIKKVLFDIEQDNYTGLFTELGNLCKGFTVEHLCYQLHLLRETIVKVEDSDKKKKCCEKAWHEYENACYWLYFLKKEVQKTTTTA